MIGHDTFRRVAGMSIDGPISLDESSVLAEHRASCAPCRAFADGLRADAAALAPASEAAVPPEVDRRVRRLLEAPGRSGLSPLALALIAAALLTAVIGTSLAVGTFLRRDDDRLPRPPAIPAEWTQVMPLTRDVRIALPSYMGVISDETSLLANDAVRAAEPGRTSWLQVSARGPSDDLPLPGTTDAQIAAWLMEMVGGSFTAPHDPMTTRWILLPAGRSLELRATFLPGDPDETRLIAYAVPSEDRYALLEIIGPPGDFDVFAADIALIPQLLETGSGLAEALGTPPPALSLRLELPGEWHVLVPSESSAGAGFQAFISDEPFPEDFCRFVAGTEICWEDGQLDSRHFILAIHELPESRPPAIGSLTGLRETSVAGFPAVVRTTAPDSGFVSIDWWVDPYPDIAGFTLVRLVTQAGEQGNFRPLVESLLDRGKFEPAG